MLETLVYKSLIRPVLFQLDPEEAHDLGQRLIPAGRGLLDVVANFYLHSLGSAAERTPTSIAGQKLPHPIGLAAGFDKNARLVNDWSSLGFAYGEVGSVTAHRSQGNARPRLFRLPQDLAIINRLGLNGDGAEAVAARLGRLLAQRPGGGAADAGRNVALNIAPSNLPAGQLIMEDDVARTFSCFKDLPLAYVTINTSCPNTHEGVLKESSQLKNVLSRVRDLNAQQLPLFLKLSPDAGDEFLRHTVDIAGEFGVRGFVLGNTSTSREGLSTDAAKLAEIGNGGLSGAPIRARALDLVRRVARLKSARQEIIACGGISSVQDVLSAIRAGACAVQLYTAFVYEGPFHVLRLRRDLALELERQGTTLQALVGADIKG
ncbi:MAG: quinone-dependent dihydroorotate dehydrogenase [Cyanobacteria bacterium SZAS LIN-3]|nr:quinone-dependent dihydroorotate dehydrogenase [Cyanobacteria bacterium SZAS LIN-3]